jgi:mRNA interferase MazF
MAEPKRGEVWLVDLGLAAKVRPCLVLSIAATAANDRALVALVAHTTSPRGSQFEVTVNAKFLKAGVFGAQNLVTVPKAKMIKSLGTLTPEQMAAVENVMRRWLNL